MTFSEKKFFTLVFLISFLTATIVGFFAGGAAYSFRKNMGANNLLEYFNQELTKLLKKEPEQSKSTSSTSTESSSTTFEQGTTTIVTQEQQIVKTVKEASPSVVSIIITKDLPVLKQKYTDPFQQFFEDSPFGSSWGSPGAQYEKEGTREKQIGGGTGFVIDSSGLIVTNKHVVSQQNANYTVLTNDGEKLKAEIIARHPSRDVAILRVDKNLPPLSLGNSNKLQLGKKLIAIGNALGEFRNTVSTGVVSGLGRQITARGAQGTERLNEVIQTDAAINQGNSGGPLLNLEGKVVGISTAMAQIAENVGFAIPINQLKSSIQQAQKEGKITIPFLGVRYLILDQSIAEANNISVNYGALIIRGNSANQMAIIPGSPADKTGLSPNDIILKMDGEKITKENTLADIIIEREPGEEVTLEYLHNDKRKTTTVKLSERSS